MLGPVSSHEADFVIDRLLAACDKQKTFSREIIDRISDIAEQLEVQRLQDIAAESVKEYWAPLTDQHIEGNWWRCSLAREIIQRELLASPKLRWSAKDMRDRENTMDWIRKMARGDRDEDTLQPGAINFWETVRNKYNEWKETNRLLRYKRLRSERVASSSRPGMTSRS